MSSTRGSRGRGTPGTERSSGTRSSARGRPARGLAACTSRTGRGYPRPSGRRPTGCGTPSLRKESILSGGMAFHILWVGVLMVVGTLGLYAKYMPRDLSPDDHARTIAFLTISLFQVFHVLAIRVWDSSVFTAGFFRNRFLIAAVLLTVALQFIVIFAPPLAAVFKTTPLPPDEGLLCAAAPR